MTPKVPSLLIQKNPDVRLKNVVYCYFFVCHIWARRLNKNNILQTFDQDKVNKLKTLYLKIPKVEEI